MYLRGIGGTLCVPGVAKMANTDHQKHRRILITTLWEKLSEKCDLNINCVN